MTTTVYVDRLQNTTASSVIARVGHDQVLGILAIEFHNGTVARYVDENAYAYMGITSAVSAGSYYNRYIKNSMARYSQPLYDARIAMNPLARSTDKPVKAGPQFAVTVRVVSLRTIDVTANNLAEAEQRALATKTDDDESVEVLSIKRK